LVYATFLGGGETSSSATIAVDGSGNVAVTGSTSGQNFPTFNPFQATNRNTSFGPNAFVAKLNASGSALIFSRKPLTLRSIATPYPNPSRIGSSVTLPIVVPPEGPFDALVEIQDAAGQHVRTLRIANANPGALPLVWDGRNDAGRATVPGLYRAWLHAGDRRVLARLVRTP